MFKIRNALDKIDYIITHISNLNNKFISVKILKFEEYPNRYRL